MKGIHDWAAAQPDKLALHFVEMDQGLTYRELEERVARAAQWLVELGLAPGDTIALLLENRPELIVLAQGARRAGLYYTPVSTHFKVAEIGHVLNDCGARVFVTSAAMAGLAQELLASGTLDSMQRFMLDASVPGYLSCEAALAAVSAGAALPQRPTGRDFLYSSGTTGLPRGIRKPLVPYADRLQQDPEVSAWQQAYGFDQHAVYLSTAPLYHAAPIRFVMRTLECGGTCIVLAKFDAEGALAAIARYRATHSQWVPTMFVRMLDLPPETRQRYDVSSMRMMVHSAAPCPVHVKERMIDWWGAVITEYYGGSEGIGLTVIGSQDWLRHKGSQGRAVLGQLHIVDDDGRELPPGEIGQVYFSGGPRFEYFNAPEKNRSAYNDRGWATYGDVGHVDPDGYLYLSDRRADLIISGGVNVYPQEIENVLVQHPSVADVGVIGVANDEFGEEVCAVVQLRGPVQPGAALGAELIDFCRERLSGIKVPRSVLFEAALPRQENGKLLRRVLKERYRKAPLPQAAAAS
jgi:long-chain acyl-CoA synthetase